MKDQHTDGDFSESADVKQARAEFETAARALWEANSAARAAGYQFTPEMESLSKSLRTAEERLMKTKTEFDRTREGRAAVELTDIVVRKVQKSFNPEEQAEAMRLLSTECARNLPFQHDADAGGLQQIWLAVVKLANGSLPELRRQIEIAQSDWREVITEAETPEALKIGLVEITKLDEKARREVEARDEAQYIAWLRDV